MAIDLSLLKMHIDVFNKAKKHINEKKNAIVGTDVEAAFDTLKEHWRTGGFEPTEMSELISIIKKNLKLFGSDRELQAELKSFSSMCEIYYTKDEDTFEVFQAIMQNKKPLDSSIIQQIYVKEFGELPEFGYSDEEHKKTNGNTLYELFNFEPETFTFRILKTIVDDKDEFRKHPLSKRGKWENFNLFSNILKDEKNKENYDAYYRFLRCKKIFKGIQRRNKNLVSKDYIDVVGELEKYKICENSTQAENLIVSFCQEIGLICKPITAQQYEEHVRRTESTRKRIEEFINQLKKKQKELESSLNGISKEIESLLSSINNSITEISVVFKNIKNNSEAIYKEEDKIKELERYISDLQNLTQKIKEIKNSRIDTLTFIEKEVRDADNKQNEINFYNVNDIFNDVSSKDAVIQKRFNEFIDKYNNDIIKKIQPQFIESKSRFYNKEKEINAERERVRKKISEEKEKLNKYQRKPITVIYIWIQTLVLAIFIFIYIPLFKEIKIEYLLFCLNAVGFIGYIILASRQFNKYNKIVETINENAAKKEKYSSTPKLIGNMIWACIIFVLVQFCFLIMENMNFSNNTFPSPSGLPMFLIISIIIFLAFRKNK